MSASKKTFSEKLAQIAKKQMKEVDSAICKMSRELFHQIVNLTPVGKNEYISAGGKVWYNTPGELVNNWQPAVMSVDTNLQQRPGPNKTGAHKRIDTVIVNGSFLTDGYVSFANSTPYVMNAENIGWPEPRWTGRTGPYLMVKTSIAEIISKYKV